MLQLLPEALLVQWREGIAVEYITWVMKQHPPHFFLSFHFSFLSAPIPVLWFHAFDEKNPGLREFFLSKLLPVLLSASLHCAVVFKHVGGRGVILSLWNTSMDPRPVWLLASRSLTAFDLPRTMQHQSLRGFCASGNAVLCICLHENVDDEGTPTENVILYFIISHSF